MNSRTLKIEEDGDHWKKRIKPKIRLKGDWLERAGFKPGTLVSVQCVADGIIELRSSEGNIHSESTKAPIFSVKSSLSQIE